MLTTMLASCACVAGLLGLVAGFLALRTLAKLRRSVGVLARTAGNDSLANVTAQHIELASGAARSVTELRAHVHDQLAQRDAGVAALVTELRTELADTLAADRGDVDARVRQGRQRLEAEAGALHEQLAQARTSVLAEIEQQRVSSRSDSDSAQEMMRVALEEVRGFVNVSLRRVALVRFDAFDDLSGRLSFSLALLDGRGDGIALTSLAGRSDTRLYAKPIVSGSAEAELTPEERQAVKAAMTV